MKEYPPPGPAETSYSVFNLGYFLRCTEIYVVAE
jgi:hypothetical protein